MNISELRTKVFEEIRQFPEDKLMELYDLIHSFRSSADDSSNDAKAILQFAGCWSDILYQIRLHNPFLTRRLKSRLARTKPAWAGFKKKGVVNPDLVSVHLSGL